MNREIRNLLEKRTAEILVLVLLIGLTAVATQASTDILDSGSSSELVAEYRFDTGGGETAYDTAGSKDGTINGASWTSGIEGRALEFDGNDDYMESGVEVDQTSEFGGFTMSAWVYPTADDARRHVLSTDNGGCDWSIHLDGDSYWNAFTGDSCGVDFQPVDLNQWQHVAIIYTENDVKFCKNGNCISRGTAPGFDSSTEDLRIGDNPDYNENWKGKIDEAKVYKKAINESQIRSIYNSGSWRIGTTTEEDNRDKVLEMSFQHQNDSHVFDTSGYNNYGQPRKGASQASAVNCKIGRCYSFNGVDQQIEISDDTTLDISDDLTLMAWINTDTLTDEHNILTKGDRGGAYHSYGLMQNGDNTQFQITTNGDNTKRLNSGSVLSKNKWIHTTGVWNGSMMKIYVDGQLEAVTSKTGDLDQETAPVQVGRNEYDGDPRWFDGHIDQVKIFNRSLSQQEIIEKSQDLEGGGTVLDLRFNQNGGDKVHDYSGEENHGLFHPNESEGPDRVKGVTGNAVELDGADDTVQVSHDNSLYIAKNNHSISGWVNINDLSDHGGVAMVNDRTASQNHESAVIVSGTTLTYTRGDGDNFDAIELSPAPEENNWVHFAAIRKGMELQWYLNGEPKNSGTLTISDSDVMDDGNPYHFGHEDPADWAEGSGMGQSG